MACLKEVYTNIVRFSNDIMNDKVKTKAINSDANVPNNRKSRTFDILNDISDYAILVHLMYSLVNVSHFVSISVVWIYDKNYHKSFLLVK